MNILDKNTYLVWKLQFGVRSSIFYHDTFNRFSKGKEDCLFSYLLYFFYLVLILPYLFFVELSSKSYFYEKKLNINPGYNVKISSTYNKTAIIYNPGDYGLLFATSNETEVLCGVVKRLFVSSYVWGDPFFFFGSLIINI